MPTPVLFLNACTTGRVTPLARGLANLAINLHRVAINADRIARGFRPLRFS